MDDQLKALMQELGNAINESLSDSDRIAAAIGEIKRAGYDVFLVLEATIGFNKRDEADEDNESNGDNDHSKNTERAQNQQRQNKQPEANTMPIRWTPNDTKFLRALKILVDDDKK